MKEKTTDHKTKIISLFLRSKNYRQYNIPIAKSLGKIEYAVLLTDMIDQYFHFEDENTLVSHPKYGDGLMFYTIDKAYERCAMNRDSFDSGIKLFIKLGFIKDYVLFGMPPKRYFRLDFEAIYEWVIQNNSTNLRNSSKQFAETRKLICGNPQTYESNNESKKETNIRLQADGKESQKSSSSLKRQEIVSFDPFTYQLADGKTLSPIMAKTLAKQMKDPKLLSLILANVSWYESQIQKGNTPRKHEAYLQSAITKNYAAKDNGSASNLLYARFLKEDLNLDGMKIMKTVVQLDKKDGSKPESISLNLPEQTFASILDNYIKNIQNKEKVS
jgi:hypothetical protein